MLTIAKLHSESVAYYESTFDPEKATAASGSEAASGDTPAGPDGYYSEDGTAPATAWINGVDAAQSVALSEFLGVDSGEQLDGAAVRGWFNRMRCRARIPVGRAGQRRETQTHPDSSEKHREDERRVPDISAHREDHDSQREDLERHSHGESDGDCQRLGNQLEASPHCRREFLVQNLVYTAPNWPGYGSLESTSRSGNTPDEPANLPRRAKQRLLSRCPSAT